MSKLSEFVHWMAGDRQATPTTPKILDFASGIIATMDKRKYTIDHGQDEVNIVYIEGSDKDGHSNENRSDYFDDLRTVISFVNGVPHIVDWWAATTQPGPKLTNNPIARAPDGRPAAAIIALGQQRCWQTGLHRGQYEGLIQTGGDVKVLRDVHKSMRRQDDDPIDIGPFGINQHHGGDSATIGGHSAGCLVGQFIKGHRDQFMPLVKRDPRWLASHRFIFATTVMPIEWVK